MDEYSTISEGGAILLAFLVAQGAVFKLMKLHPRTIICTIISLIFMIGAYNMFNVVFEKGFTWTIGIGCVVCMCIAGQLIRDIDQPE